jgi:hypothetical protein
MTTYKHQIGEPYYWSNEMSKQKIEYIPGKYNFNPATTYTNDVMENKGITFKQNYGNYICPDGWKKYGECVNDYCTKDYNAPLNVWDTYIHNQMDCYLKCHTDFWQPSKINNNLYA